MLILRYDRSSAGCVERKKKKMGNGKERKKFEEENEGNETYRSRHFVGMSFYRVFPVYTPDYLLSLYLTNNHFVRRFEWNVKKFIYPL